jgi:hypothetical protein
VKKRPMKSVEFDRFDHDKSNERLWRFSQDLDRMVGDSIKSKNVVTVFDTSQMGEMIVPIDPFIKKSVKDGKLWSYVNSDDELGVCCVGHGKIAWKVIEQFEPT